MPRILRLLRRIGLFFANHSRSYWSYSLLERLPVEILLVIAEFLSEPNQVLLKFTCKRLYSIIDRYMSPAACNKEEKIMVSKHLEDGWPKYLTCRLCGMLFKWRHRVEENYVCPRRNKHNMNDLGISIPLQVPRGPGRYTYITLEIRDLIHRYYEQGSQYGIPTSALCQASKESLNFYWQETEARWVFEQLLVSVCWKFELASAKLDTKPWRKIRTCVHQARNLIEWQGSQADTGDRLGTIETMKCPYCACDVVVNLQESSNDSNSVRVMVSAWRNYGNSSSNDIFHRQMFTTHDLVRIDDDVLAARNLHEMFNGGKIENCAVLETR